MTNLYDKSREHNPNILELNAVRWWKMASDVFDGSWHYVIEWCHGAYCGTQNEDYIFLRNLASKRSEIDNGQ